MSTIGATMAFKGKCVLDDASDTDENASVSSEEDSTCEECMDEVQRLFDASDDVQSQCMVASLSSGKPRGVSPETLSKVWRIDMDTAKKTLDIISTPDTHRHRKSVCKSLHK